ncbi:hypothetical protein HK104_003325 [Borealophlyctis nickersoniae]|nr:hypothetical protein HK104_003325 [Borealophlyctis nickersoniae]
MGSSHSSDHSSWSHADPDTLRAKASEEAKLRNACFEQSRAAYAAGRKAEAKTLSDKGKQHDANMKQLNQQAADAAFAAANGGPDRPPEEVDLHGLHVQEAMEVVETHIRKCRKAGLKRAVVITGKGNRSVDGVARIKPAVEELCVRESIRAEPDPHNPGRIILHLDVPKSAVGWFMDSNVLDGYIQADGLQYTGREDPTEPAESRLLSTAALDLARHFIELVQEETSHVEVVDSDEADEDINAIMARG